MKYNVTELRLDSLEQQSFFNVEREIIQQKIYREKQSFYEQSIKDPLTDLYNRTYMNETIPRIFSHHDRGLLKEIVLLMLDLDHFKAVNDTFGHNTGDIVLKRVSEIIQKSLRAGDFAVRVGGEEIAVFLVLESPEFKMSIADRIRNEIKSIDFSDCMYSKKQTISGGAVLRKKKETLEVERKGGKDGATAKEEKRGAATVVGKTGRQSADQGFRRVIRWN